MYGAANSERRRRRQDSNSDGEDQQLTTPNGHKRVCIRNNTVRSRGLQRIAEEDVPTTSRDMPPAPIYPVGGRVVSVQLQNFMCHSHLKVSFDVERNNCFYIGGPNGSGKSALFAAMNIGLGGRGNHNDR
uniref:Rad50/SbcC-type AAA domain-containing protein n=1 Tax=Plectus sambesii TaxID=2011161 RepID=A0A914W579_9BILA